MDRWTEDDILNEIKKERLRQRELSFDGDTGEFIGQDAFDKLNSQNDWVAYICAYAGRAANCLRNDTENQDFRKNMIKVAALVVAAIEAIG